MIRTRYVEIFRNDNWERDSFMNVKNGDEFKLYEEDGTFVSSGVASSDAYEEDGKGVILSE